ncbi:MAG: bifunctional 5,10-methylene-tetrahydrofolate dehydrogenase/5,10-methylene-tetrahydrofolate cyclohydrolase [Oscillospiraceae bacterium]|jgi:methylenetetrahydrofolate dehydrogenase (NADP+)/methenyltetrahydrofolate cyclohydrolase|nr:bifunctional 5,10-methylene-tetrahydrofolate dehydrogenase/5,10-methylene-tetrahydrofolate cyclohydrolase [Oscillospiraceae bacterium]
MAEIWKGQPVADKLNEKMKEDIAALAAKGVAPTLAIVRVGEKASDISYEKGAIKRSETVGVAIKHVLLPADITQDAFIAEIKALNADKSVHGILVFRPLPEQLDDTALRETLLPEKDVDGITPGSLGTAMAGGVGPGFSPCTAQAVMEILDFYEVDVKGKDVTVIGNSLVVGLPLTNLLSARFATVTNCHIFTKDVPAKAKSAEILISAAGKAGLVSAKHMSEGQIIIDVGINFTPEGKMCGDVTFEDAEAIAKAATPVPGGVGSVTTGVLVSHVVEAAKRSVR